MVLKQQSRWRSLPPNCTAYPRRAMAEISAPESGHRYFVETAELVTLSSALLHGLSPSRDGEGVCVRKGRRMMLKQQSR